MGSTKIEEKEKYHSLWSSYPQYREFSLGEVFVNHFLNYFDSELKKSDTIYDFGCGTSRVAKRFLERKLNVHLIDITRECLDQDIDALTVLQPSRVQFTEACLWDLPSSLKKEKWLYCCDVMEHIPEEKVDETLKQIAQKIEKGGYFSICLKDDHFGEVFGQKLHLTVKSKEWWEEKVGKYFVIEKSFSVHESLYFNCIVGKPIL